MGICNCVVYVKRYLCVLVFEVVELILVGLWLLLDV